MIRILTFLLLAFAPALVLAQSETCPRIWRSGDSLLTDPAPHIQWLRDGVPIPDANRSWHLPTEAGRYSVEVRGGFSTTFPYETGSGYVLAGYVFDELHRPVAGATVRRGRFSATTDSSGRFELRIAEAKPAEQTPVVVSVEKAGYWRNASRQYISAFHTTETRMLLHTKRVTNRVDATQGGELAYRGFTLRIPPNAVQTESGTLYSGTILLSVEGARPTEPDFGLRMPGGDFAAIDESGNDVMLYSYGYISVEMHSESGEKLELRPEARATLRFALPYTETHRPDRVPLWHFDTDRAIWEQEGWSVRNGSIYEGEVSHFSAWNCDIPAVRGTVRGRLLDCYEQVVKRGWVCVGQRYVVTDSLGRYWAFVPGGITFDAWSSADTLRRLTVAAQEERTLDNLGGGAAFDGSAFWNAQTQELDVFVSGQVSPMLRLSVDGGQTWSTQRTFAGLTAPPERVLVEDSCRAWLRVWMYSQQVDCRQMTLSELDSANIFYRVDQALASTEPVIRLNLNFGNFTPQVMSLLPTFSCLQSLNIWWNQLPTLPEAIGGLVLLQRLEVDGNQLTSLPESIGNLTQLRELDLNSNQLTSLPESIGNLTELRNLELFYNRLTTLPESIGNLINLELLDLAPNRLTDLPESIGNLTNLRVFDLDGNQLRELPESIGNLVSLRNLDLSKNRLTSLPASIGNLTNLRRLDLDSNRLANVPASIGNLINLQLLDLDNNRLTDLPVSIGNLSSLEFLVLAQNQLTDLPANIGNLNKLTMLSLDRNQLTDLPASIGNLSSLRTLTLYRNELTDLPATLGNLTNLEKLELSENWLTDLPASIANLADTLQQLDLRGNPIPVERRAAIQAMLPNTTIRW